MLLHTILQYSYDTSAAALAAVVAFHGWLAGDYNVKKRVMLALLIVRRLIMMRPLLLLPLLPICCSYPVVLDVVVLLS
jgi:hypothetical protein